MKIYTYYEDINFHKQQDLLELWKKGWNDRGFQPIILSLDDAKKSSYYYEFLDGLKDMHKFITGNELGKYGLSCYMRWLAYSVQDEELPFLVSDYDVINKNFIIDDIKETTEELCFLDGFCPCFCYGTKEQYLKFCKDIIFYSNQYKNEIKNEFEVRKFRHYHDQEFLALNNKKYSHKILKPRTYITFYEHGNPIMNECKLFHFAHRSIGEAKVKFPELNDFHSEELRIDFIKKILNIYH